jgi:plasmid stabilization system protein ParE
MSVRWSTRARADLYEIAGRIAEDDPNAAANWLDAIEKHVLDTAGTIPLGGRIVPELRRADLRETVLGKRYRIVYRVVRRDAVIVTIFDGHRRWRADVDPDDK